MWYAISNSDDNQTAEVSIYDEIGGWGIGAKQFLGDISKLAGKHLHVRINSPGGSVIEGTAIFNALRRHVGGVTVHIDGLAASMASVIAMAGLPVLMADNALLMIHNPWTVAMGDSEDMRKTADLLDKLKANIRNAYERKTGMDADKLQEMMDAETWLDAVDSVALGFADAIEEGVEAAAHIQPAELRAKFDSFAQKMTAQNSETPENPEIPGEGQEPETPETPVVDPVTEPEAPEAPEDTNEPQAHADLISRVQAITLENGLLKAELEASKNTIERLSALAGVAPAVVVPPIGAQSEPAANLLDQFNAISEPAERTRFYRQNEAELKRLLASAKQK